MVKQYPKHSGDKLCNGCKKQLPLDSFYTKTTKKGTIIARYKCKNCLKQYAIDNQEHISKRVKQYYNNNQEKYWEQKIKRLYGITLSQYNNLLETQKYKCAICALDLTNYRYGKISIHTKPSIDHDHKTGKVRGILCNPCNIGLGAFKDSDINLDLAIKYLRNSKYVY